MFMGEDARSFAENFKIKLLHSSPYYAQTNGQAESTNKLVKMVIQKLVEENPRTWHDKLSEVLWALRTSQKTTIGTSPFRLVYGHDAMLPMELTVVSLRRQVHHKLLPSEYADIMLQELDQLDKEWLLALYRVIVQKKRVERAYNKKVKFKYFKQGDLIWKLVLPIGHKDRSSGKWSPNWEGPFIVAQVLQGGAYILTNKDESLHLRPINGKYLKAYVSSMWDDIDRSLFSK